MTHDHDDFSMSDPPSTCFSGYNEAMKMDGFDFVSIFEADDRQIEPFASADDAVSLSKTTDMAAFFEWSDSHETIRSNSIKDVPHLGKTAAANHQGSQAVTLRTGKQPADNGRVHRVQSEVAPQMSADALAAGAEIEARFSQPPAFAFQGGRLSLSSAIFQPTVEIAGQAEQPSSNKNPSQCPNSSFSGSIISQASCDTRTSPHLSAGECPVSGGINEQNEIRSGAMSITQLCNSALVLEHAQAGPVKSHVRVGRHNRQRSATAPSRPRRKYRPRGGRNPAFDHPGQGQFQIEFLRPATASQRNQGSASALQEQATAVPPQKRMAAGTGDSSDGVAFCKTVPLDWPYNVNGGAAHSRPAFSEDTLEQDAHHRLRMPPSAASDQAHGISSTSDAKNMKVTGEVVHRGRGRADSGIGMETGSGEN